MNKISPGRGDRRDNEADLLTSSTRGSSLLSSLDPQSLDLFMMALETITQGGDVRTSMHHVLSQLGEAWGWERITLYRFPADGETVEAVLSTDAPLQWQARFKLASYPELAMVREEKRDFFISRISRDIFLKPQHERLDQAGIVCMHLLPLIRGGRLLGVLSFKAFHSHENLSTGEIALSPLLSGLFSLIGPPFPSHSVEGQSSRTLYKQFAGYLKSALHGLLVVNGAGTILEITPAVTRNFGYDEDRLKGKSLLHILDPEDHEKILSLIREALAAPTGVIQRDATIIGSDGEKYRMLVTLMPDPMTGDTVMVALTTFTSYMTLDDFLEQFRLHLKDIIWDASDFIYILDEDDRYLAVNRALCEATGYTQSEFYAVDFPGISAPEEKSLSRRRLEDLFEGKDLLPRLAHIRTKTGEIIPVDVHVHPITDNAKKVMAVMGIARDLRPRIRQRIKEHSLRTEIEEKMERLAAANLKLEEEGAFRSTFVSASAHHLKTPIATVKATLEILRTDIAPNVPMDLDPLLQPAWDSLCHVETLISNLVDLASIQNRAAVTVIRGFSLRELFDPILTSLSPLLKAKNVSIDTSITPETLTWSTDRSKLEQIVDTLLTNALNVSPEGGSIGLNVSMTDDRLVITVTDQGPGIDESELPKIFTPFSHPVLSGMHQGVGLALAKAQTDVLKGHISVQSSPDGTIFRLECPRIETY